MAKERDQSEFNMAVSYLNRLNVLFYMADKSAMDLDAYKWYHSLMCLFRELSTEMDADEIKNKEEELYNINVLIQHHLRERQKTGSGRINPDLYKKLHGFEMWIRKILKEAGLQQRMKDDFLAPTTTWDDSDEEYADMDVSDITGGSV